MSYPWSEPTDHRCRFNFEYWDGGLIQYGQFLRPLYTCLWPGCGRGRVAADVPDHRCTFRRWEVRARLGPRELVACDLPECENLIPIPRELPQDEDRVPRIRRKVNMAYRHFIGRVRTVQEDSDDLFDRLAEIRQGFETLEAFCEGGDS
jgi:hypothetical protein